MWVYFDNLLNSEYVNDYFCKLQPVFVLLQISASDFLIVTL